MRAQRIAAVCALLLVVSTPARAQTTLRTQCEAASRAEVRAFCENVADATVIIQPRLGVTLTGGNPVPGTASTLGMRLGRLPRISLAGRVSAAGVDLPAVAQLTSDDDISFPIGSINADVSIGLFSGLNLLPTVGGFASVDLLASIGTLPLPRGEGFDDDAPITWAVGARIGLLRESFTAPGVSVSGMYRQLGDVAYGSETLSDRDAFFSVTDYHVTSLRATVGKRLLGFGLTAGAGYDRYNSDIAARVRDPRVLDPSFVLMLSEDDLASSRTMFFGNASFTLLILNLAAELGWQQGGNRLPTATDKLEKGAVFGGIAIRIAI